MLSREGQRRATGVVLRSLISTPQQQVFETLPSAVSVLPCIIRSIRRSQGYGFSAFRGYCTRNVVNKSTPNQLFYQNLYNNNVNLISNKLRDSIMYPCNNHLMREVMHAVRNAQQHLPQQYRQNPLILQHMIKTLQSSHFSIWNSTTYLYGIHFPYVRNLKMGINLPRWQNVVYPEWMRITGIWARVAIVNGLNTVGHNLPYMLAALVAQLMTENRLAYCRAAAEGPLPFDGRWQTLVDQDKEKKSKKSQRMEWLQSLLLIAANAIRIFKLVWLFGGLICMAPFALQYGWGREKWLEKLRVQLEVAGPAFIKWGQWVATRHDMFPPDMCKELSKLHTQAPQHNFEFTNRAFEESFGVPISWVFNQFETQPVASGSIGQIHVGTLSANGAELSGYQPGTKVAVKVRHPGVGHAIEQDFAMMMAAAGVASWFPGLKHLRLEESLTQFSAPLREQVDLALEARHLWRFNYNFRKNNSVTFPMPIFPWISESILVETFEEGEHVNQFIERDNPELHKSRLAQLGSDTMLQMLLSHNFLHSDLHPGNIKVRMEPPGGFLLKPIFDLISHLPNSKNFMEQWLYPKVVLLDVGMSTQLSDLDRSNLYDLFKAFSELDGYNVGRCTLSFAGKNQSCPDPEKFQQELGVAFEKLKKIQSWQESSSEFGSSADCLNQMLEMARQYSVNIPGHICAVVITTLVLEGWSGELDPEHSVLNDVKRVVKMNEAGNFVGRWLQSMGETLVGDADCSINDSPYLIA